MKQEEEQKEIEQHHPRRHEKRFVIERQLDSLERLFDDISDGDDSSTCSSSSGESMANDIVEDYHVGAKAKVQSLWQSPVPIVSHTVDTEEYVAKAGAMPSLSSELSADTTVQGGESMETISQQRPSSMKLKKSSSADNVISIKSVSLLGVATPTERTLERTFASKMNESFLAELPSSNMTRSGLYLKRGDRLSQSDHCRGTSPPSSWHQPNAQADPLVENGGSEHSHNSRRSESSRHRREPEGRHASSSLGPGGSDHSHSSRQSTSRRQQQLKVSEASSSCVPDESDHSQTSRNSATATRTRRPRRQSLGGEQSANGQTNRPPRKQRSFCGSSGHSHSISTSTTGNGRRRSNSLSKSDDSAPLPRGSSHRERGMSSSPSSSTSRKRTSLEKKNVTTRKRGGDLSLSTRSEHGTTRSSGLRRQTSARRLQSLASSCGGSDQNMKQSLDGDQSLSTRSEHGTTRSCGLRRQTSARRLQSSRSSCGGSHQTNTLTQSLGGDQSLSTRSEHGTTRSCGLRRQTSARRLQSSRSSCGGSHQTNTLTQSLGGDQSLSTRSEHGTTRSGGLRRQTSARRLQSSRCSYGGSHQNNNTKQLNRSFSDGLNYDSISNTTTTEVQEGISPPRRVKSSCPDIERMSMASRSCRKDNISSSLDDPSSAVSSNNTQLDTTATITTGTSTKTAVSSSTRRSLFVKAKSIRTFVTANADMGETTNTNKKSSTSRTTRQCDDLSKSEHNTTSTTTRLGLKRYPSARKIFGTKQQHEDEDPVGKEPRRVKSSSADISLMSKLTKDLVGKEPRRVKSSSADISLMSKLTKKLFASTSSADGGSAGPSSASSKKAKWNALPDTDSGEWDGSSLSLSLAEGGTTTAASPVRFCPLKATRGYNDTDTDDFDGSSFSFALVDDSTTTTTAPPPPPAQFCPLTAGGYDDAVQKYQQGQDASICLEVVNDIRTKYKLRSLQRHKALDAQAQIHAEAIAKSNGNYVLKIDYMGHVLRGSSTGTIYDIHTDAMKGRACPFKAKCPAKGNIINPDFHTIGIGIAKGTNDIMYVCELFHGQFTLFCG